MASKITQKTIKLKKHHTHAGRDYEPGAILTMDSDSAEWLIAMDAAEDAPKSAQPAKAD